MIASILTILLVVSKNYYFTLIFCIISAHIVKKVIFSKAKWYTTYKTKVHQKVVKMGWVSKMKSNKKWSIRHILYCFMRQCIYSITNNNNARAKRYGTVKDKSFEICIEWHKVSHLHRHGTHTLSQDILLAGIHKNKSWNKHLNIIIIIAITIVIIVLVLVRLLHTYCTKQSILTWGIFDVAR